MFAFKRKYTKNIEGIKLQTLDFSDLNIYLFINTVPTCRCYYPMKNEITIRRIIARGNGGNTLCIDTHITNTQLSLS